MRELERRLATNQAYSLRAFAKALQINPSMLSMVLSKKRRLSLRMAQKLANNLGLDPKTADRFVAGVNGAAGNNEKDRSHVYRDFSLDQFEAISKWYHFGILSLIETNDFSPSPTWIASRLGIRVIQVKAALERLVRMKILDTSGPKWKQTGGSIMIENKVSTAATRAFQTDVLAKAKESIDNDASSIRDFSSITLALDPADIPLAAEEIRKFRTHLMNLLEANPNPREVYHMAIQLYPITKKP